MHRYVGTISNRIRTSQLFSFDHHLFSSPTHTGIAFRSSPPSSHDTDLFILAPFFILHPHIQSSSSSATPYQIECHFSNKHCFPFQLATTIHIPSLQSAINHLLTSNSSSSPSSSPWHLGWGSTSIASDIASTFVVLKPLNQHPLPSLRNIQCWDLNSLSAALSLINNTSGTTIKVLGCPFGTLAPFYFKKWHARGIISNTIAVTTDSTTITTNAAAIYMVDAKTLPGMEGSPVLIDKSDQSSLLGVLLPPLRLSSFHNNNTPATDVNIVAPIESILHAMMMTDSRIPTNVSIHNNNNNTTTTTNGVVAVRERYSGSWASGIVMSNTGLILTVAHLLPVRGGTRIQIEVGIRRGGRSNGLSSSIHWLPATLIYTFTKAPHLDVAILQVANNDDDVDWHPVPLPDITTTTILEGRSINIVGYSLFNPSSSYISGPSVTVGNITRTVYHPLNKHTIAMIMTNAAVHGGGSGGAVIDSETGELIGMVTSNAKLNKNPTASSTSRSNNVVIIPDMSFVLPVNVLLPIIQAAIQGEGSKVEWGRYDVKDKVLESIWALKDGGGGGFGGARPPEALSRLVAQLDEEEGSGGGNSVERSRL